MPFFVKNQGHRRLLKIQSIVTPTPPPLSRFCFTSHKRSSCVKDAHQELNQVTFLNSGLEPHIISNWPNLAHSKPQRSIVYVLDLKFYVNQKISKS